jgi:hypothetical protein
MEWNEDKRTLELVSGGPNNLPYSGVGDLIVKKQFPRHHGDPDATVSEVIEKNLEALTRGLTKGSVGGVRQGMKEGGKDATHKD